MGNAAGDVWIAYNGEVYDWAADARELEAAGYAFRTRSDTEFILHAYEHWGIDCVDAPARHVRDRDRRPARGARCTSSATGWA